MAFQFVLGRAGAGKTTWCLDEIKQRLIAAPQGAPLIWLVPEQATFQAEYALISVPELGGTLRAQVLSFRRLAWRVMQEVGGTARLPIDDTGKKLLLHRIIHRNRDRLQRMHGAAEQHGFLEQLNELLTEFKRYNVTPSHFAGMEGKLEAGLAGAFGSFAPKLDDLRLIYEQFEAELSRAYLDGEDYLTLLAQQIKASPYIQGAMCWVDGFHGFTPQEVDVLEQLALHAEQVTLTLCLNRPYAAREELPELELFHPTARTMQQVTKRLHAAGVQVDEPVVLASEPAARHHHNPMLAHLETHLWSRRRPAYRLKAEETETAAVKLTAAVNRRAEVEGMARDIIRLVREDGLRWRDIAVSVRSIEVYGDLIAGTFADYGIPLFFDQKRSVLHHPLVEFIRSALEVARLHWRYDAVFRCVKTGFFQPRAGSSQLEAPVGRYAFDQLENYVLAFGIQGSRWRMGADWTYTYDASLESDGAGSEANARWLEQINRYRRLVTGPLGELQDRLRERKRVRDRVEAVYDLLVALQIPEQLESWGQAALRSGKPEKAREHSQVWDRVIDMFDQLVELLGDEELPLDQFSKLIDAGMESIKLGLVPPTLDQVLIGSMDRTRSAQVKHLFVLGANEGVMPSKIVESGVLTEAERMRLAEAGLQLAEDSRRRLLDEPFLIYHALSTPSEALWISYPLADEEGKSLLPSEVVRHVKRLFPDVQERLLLSEPSVDAAAAEQLEFVAEPGKAMSLLFVQLKQWVRGVPIHDMWWSVYNWFVSQPEYEPKLRRLLLSLQYTNSVTALTESTSRELYGDSIAASVSRMERFVSCPFSQFVSHGLRLKERRLYTLEAPDIGQLFHAALSQFAEQVAAEGLDWSRMSDAEYEARAASVVEALSPRLQGEILLSSERYRYIARKLTQVISKAAAMLGVHAKRSQFQPIALEVGFGDGQPIPPLEYELANGVRMQLRGRIDRVDKADTELGTLLRIIDYKSSSKALQLGDVYYGLSLQMLTYLEVVLTHAESWLGTTAKPAGVLYFHVHNPMLQVKNALTAEQLDKELKKRFKMKGLLSADADIVRLMDSGLIGAGGHSELLPAALKTDGSFYKTSSVASDEEWSTIRRHVKRTIQEIGGSMVGGRIAIEPYRTRTAAACQGCSFKEVCQFDTQLAGNAYRQLPPLSRTAALELMERDVSRTAELERPLRVESEQERSAQAEAAPASDKSAAGRSFGSRKRAAAKVAGGFMQEAAAAVEANVEPQENPNETEELTDEGAGGNNGYTEA
ncbi:helicase-exonuclease AddAB subunit AddB [Paenibacillus sp. YYML68]|uniref:helicase-exonuclease AddAB subunit AddB n=1 Tax=Paenibacillus sp. YYML68 TaxID=2909250 RepID=UPI002493819D|nr:helicase-exonuclease AddAB subunit AddB [Paenibacillus sp. YYML68]